MRLPEPTPIQYDIADWLQNGPRRRGVEAFRGVGKSWITIAFVCWKLKMNPNLKIGVVSASRSLADNFSTGCLNLINTWDLLEDIRPPEGDRTWRSSKVQFDVNGADNFKDPSVRSEGINGQVTGMRADLIIADDIETPQTAETQHKRDKLAELVKEFDSIMSKGGEVVYLGTPHTEDSLYNKLQERGYSFRIWPARFPQEKQLVSYGSRLAPYIRDEWADNRVGEPTDPKRFNEDELAEREGSYGRSGFQLQFMLDTSLSDAERYPLKLSDLVIDDLDTDQAYEKIVWAAEPKRRIEELICLGLKGDHYYRPMERLGVMRDYQGGVMFIDPSGRGKDETGYAIAKFLNGFVFVPECCGLRGGYEEVTLRKLLAIAEDNKISKVLIESNFGDGMFTQLLKGVLQKINTERRREKKPELLVGFEEVSQSKQKELRIIDTLEPIMNRHRLIVDPKVIDRDYESIKEYPAEQKLHYSLAHQMTRITKERGCLRHDDRLDALAGAVAYWVDRMAQDETQRMLEAELEDIERELLEFEESAGIFRGASGPSWIKLPGRN